MTGKRKRKWRSTHTPAQARVLDAMRKGNALHMERDKNGNEIYWLAGSGTEGRAVRVNLARRIIKEPNILPQPDALFAGVKPQSWLWREPIPRGDGKERARRNGTTSIFAGSEPRHDELTAHYPKVKKCKPQRPALSKSKAKRLRKEKKVKRAEALAYQARLTASWPIYITEKGKEE